jgi:hypothetical protein
VKAGLWVNFAVLLAGCGGVLGIEDFKPPKIQILLRDFETGTRLPGTVVTLWRDDQGPVKEVARVTTDADGQFDLVMTTELPLDGYFEIVDPRYLHTFSHLAQPVVDHADHSADILTTTAAGLQRVADNAGMSQTAGTWLVIAQVLDDGGQVAQATVHAKRDGTPIDDAKICYTKDDDDDDKDVPCGRTTTGADGKAWLFDIPGDASSLVITAMDAEGKRHEVPFPLETGPGIVYTPVPVVP